MVRDKTKVNKYSKNQFVITHQMQFHPLFVDIFVTGDCSIKSIVWENVTVDPRLSVEHGTLITFTCVSGTSNFGGETAHCKNGTLIPTDGPPQCYGTYHDLSFLLFVL